MLDIIECTLQQFITPVLLRKVAKLGMLLSRFVSLRETVCEHTVRKKLKNLSAPNSKFVTVFLKARTIKGVLAILCFFDTRQIFSPPSKE